MAYIIEDGIDYKQMFIRSHMNRKYPWNTMKVGQSFHVKYEGRTNQSLSSSLLSSAKAYCKRRGLKNTYITRSDDNGVRIFLIASDSPDVIVKPEPVQVRDPYADYDARPAEKVYQPNPFLPKFK